MDLSSGDITLGGSLANLSITQPLLRGASRRIFLESLTQSERSLLADARRLEQFRQGLFLDVAIGANPAGRVGGGSDISLVSSIHRSIRIPGTDSGNAEHPQPGSQCRQTQR